jgi:amino acid transporter
LRADKLSKAELVVMMLIVTSATALRPSSLLAVAVFGSLFAVTISTFTLLRIKRYPVRSRREEYRAMSSLGLLGFLFILYSSLGLIDFVSSILIACMFWGSIVPLWALLRRIRRGLPLTNAHL